MTIWKRVEIPSKSQIEEESYIELEDYFYNLISTCPEDFAEELECIAQEYSYYLAIGMLAKELAVKGFGKNYVIKS